MPDSSHAEEVNLQQTAEFRDSLFQAVFENDRLGIAGVLPDGHVIVSNGAFRRTLGYSAAELARGTTRDWTVPADWEKEQRLIASLLRGAIHRYELTKHCLDKHGQSIWLHVTVTVINRKTKLLMVISEHLDPWSSREHEALRKSELHLRAIFENSLDGIFLLNSDGEYLDANPAGCELLGRTRSEIASKTFGTFSQRGDPTRALWNQLKREGTARGEMEVIRSDGSLRFAEVTITADILPGLTLAISRDNTEKKKLEQRLAQKHKMEAIGRLAGGVAHDFNNMLTVIRGYCELLRKKLPDGTNLSRYADSILSAADRSSMITQQLLAFSRRQVVQPQRLSVNHVIADLSQLLQRLIGEDVQLAVELTEDSGDVFADAVQLGQVLMNLAVNSRDAMPHGGHLVIKTANVQFEAANSPKSHLCVNAGDYVMISVTDTGCGMSKEVEAHIFEPFFTTKEQGKGTGLGLATVYGIVQQCQGGITVYSQPGSGTTFNVYLPRVDKQPTPHRDESTL